MKKVITYGTFDLLHYGHLRLLERAKALGDWLIVGVTSDDFDKNRGKINVRQSLTERIEAVRKCGLADEIIVEEYEGQKIDDIRKYGADIFAIGSDWTGKFDYLREYCEVVYLDRTEGVSSSELRAEESTLRLGLVGASSNVTKVEKEAGFVNGLRISGSVQGDGEEYDRLLECSDAVYVYAHPFTHTALIKKALLSGKHVLAETPVTVNLQELQELRAIAEEKGLVLMEALKTAFSTAFSRLVLMVKSGRIGRVVSVDANCTSLSDVSGLSGEALDREWGSFADWGPTALLPVLEILGTDYLEKQILTMRKEAGSLYDLFTKVSFVYGSAAGSVKVGKGVKSEGELIVSGTEGYIYVPAPWWKTDFFEIRYENPLENRRFFYPLEGEGIRYELVAFLQNISGIPGAAMIEPKVTEAIAGLMEDYYAGKDVTVLGGPA